ncbi:MULTISPECIES: cell envelope integrity protein TolA [Burkholderia]|uniref:cell envelope integrity protein TolA n=1 Tax=Burkholderia TaxID=32008 RepID=UPI000841EEA9|nr:MULTISPECIES: cell envelope integrity protein TolA [unclassified Burkholderia]AOK28909.1 protein TolA [Burkholderia sp. Bp7605]
MMSSQPRAAYPHKPPRERGTGRAFLLAALMHVLLALFLYHGIQWPNSTPAGAQAELWTEIPDTSVPRPAPPVKAAPAPEPVKNDEADIALQQRRRAQQAAAREAQLEEQRRQRLKAQQLAAQQAAQLAAQQAAEREKQKQADKLKQQQLASEQQRRLEQQKLEQLKKQEKQEQLAAQKKAEAEKAAKAAAAAKANAAARAKLDKERQARLAQLQGMAGSGGGEGLAKSGTGTGSGGTAASPGYADKVRRRVKPHIVWGGEREGLVTVVSIRCTPSGDVLSASIRRSSGNSGWDQAVINAIQASVPLPPDTNGQTPSQITITFRAAE